MNSKERALDYVNRARKAMHLSSLKELPKGKLKDGQQCSIARALENTITVDSLYIEFNDIDLAYQVFTEWYEDGNVLPDKEVYTPYNLGVFIDEFDAGKYPELIEETNNETEK